MRPTVAHQDLSIIVGISNHQPNFVNPNFLLNNGIVPGEWQLAKPPITQPSMAHLAFTNGINLVAKMDSITFNEFLTKKKREEIKSASLAHKYVRSLSQFGYKALKINPGSFITFPNADPNAVRHYFTKNLLAPGSWNKTGSSLLKASLNLTYALEKCPLHLSIREVVVQLDDASPKPAILFSGEFLYELTGENLSRRLEQLHQYIDRWQEDLETFNSLIYDKFLNSEEMLS